MRVYTKVTGGLKYTILLAAAIGLLVGINGCSSDIQTVQFKINSEPEGSHVALKVSGPNRPRSSEWIYLGHTPIRIVRQFVEDDVPGAKITLKVMHAGYYDQVREWDGEVFLNEAVKGGVLFWTPELVPHPTDQ
ncbi:MAG: hypothetical protein DSY50_04095 [Desulfobulbus sp.]|nr:MAG: hypothetical protein DSY50_04095 [Desulfobulbus sp.]RUM40880.1 MAG: hypothetical protein DSY70_02545 [Desulfobulbus sp.]